MSEGRLPLELQPPRGNTVREGARRVGARLRRRVWLGDVGRPRRLGAHARVDEILPLDVERVLSPLGLGAEGWMRSVGCGAAGGVGGELLEGGLAHHARVRHGTGEGRAGGSGEWTSSLQSTQVAITESSANLEARRSAGEGTVEITGGLRRLEHDGPAAAAALVASRRARQGLRAAKCPVRSGRRRSASPPHCLRREHALDF